MLSSLVASIAVALTLSLLATPVVRLAALRWKFVDLPDNRRKVHSKPLPRIGGVAIFVAYFGSFLGIAVLSNSLAVGVVKSFAPAALLVFLVGLLDDVIGLKPWHKLAAEVLAAILLISSGVYIHGVPTAVGMLCTILWLVLCVNAVNLIDGLDGLAAGIALLATLTILAASVLCGNVELAIATAPLAGSLMGFLVFNFNPASIFLGDSGSLLIGFLLACYGILWSSKSATIPKMAAPMIALAVPLADTTLAIVRRFLREQPIFSPDRSHVHHRLIALGFTHRRAVLVLYSAACFAGLSSLFLIAAAKRWEPFVIVCFAAAVFFAMQRLGYAELEAARRILTSSAFHRELSGQLAVLSFEDKLGNAQTASDCWAVIREASHDFGFHPIHLRLEGRMFADEPESNPRTSWVLHMPISQDDWIELCHELGPVRHASAVLSFAEAIRKVLNTKRAALARFGRQEGPTSAATGGRVGLASGAQHM